MENFKNQQILEKYKSFKQLGQGAISGIYYAETIADNQPVAIKVVTKKRIQDQEQNRYFQQELDVTKAIMAQGKNENIVNILELIEGQDEYFIVTEYYKDGDLLNVLEQFSFQFSQDVAISFCIAIANGLNFLHKSKICHRDLKPENILIAKQSNGNFLIKISDFGISKQSDQMMKSTIGTITYMAPEILKFQSYDEKVDIWSFGCLVYEIFVGEQLFGGKSMKEVALNITGFQEEKLDKKADRLPQSVIKLIKKCLKRLPSQRTSLDKIIEELLQIRAEMKVNMAQSILISQNNNPQHNQQQIKDGKNKSINLESTFTNQSVEVIEGNSNIKFTDNLNDSFEGFIVDKEEENENQQDNLPIALTQAMSFVGQEEEEMNYITPKNNYQLDKDNKEKITSNNQQGSENQLKILEEEKKNKKLEDKTKYNEYLAQNIQNQPQIDIKRTITLQAEPDIEQSIVLQKTSNPNYKPFPAHLMTPQHNKAHLYADNYPQQFLSEQKPYDLKINEFNKSPISTFNSNHYSPSNQQKFDQSPIQNATPIKISNPLNNQEFQMQANLTPIKDISIGEPKVPSFEALSTKVSYQAIQSQTYNQKTTVIPSYLNSPYQTSFTPTQLPNEATYMYQAYTAVPQYNQSNTSNGNKYISDQISQNNSGSDIQQILNMYQSAKSKPKQKINFMVDQAQDAQNLQKIKLTLATISDAESHFQKDNKDSKYKFQNVYFDEIKQYLPCVKIDNTDDRYILEFLSFIHSNIQAYHSSYEILLKQYIYLILMNKESYFQISEYLKNNQQYLNPFLKVLLNIVEINDYTTQDSKMKSQNKFQKLYEMTKSTRFLEFLKTFGNLLQTFKQNQQTKTQHLFKNMQQKDYDEINELIKQKSPFQLSQELPSGNVYYFVEFNN